MNSVSTLGSCTMLAFLFHVLRAKTADCSQSSLKDLHGASLCSPWVFLQGTRSFVAQTLALLHLETSVFLNVNYCFVGFFVGFCFFFSSSCSLGFFLSLDLGPLSFFGGLLPYGLTSLQGSSREVSLQTERFSLSLTLLPHLTLEDSCISLIC